MGAFHTTAATLMCPHGGTVTLMTSNARAKAGGALVVTSADALTIAGCPFIVAGVASPCVLVQWTVTDMRVRANGAPTVGAASVGLCIGATGAPQGTVVAVQTQARATAQ